MYSGGEPGQHHPAHRTARRQRAVRVKQPFFCNFLRACREGFLHVFSSRPGSGIVGRFHSSCISASTAEMSRSADASWGKIPTTRASPDLPVQSPSVDGSDPSPPAPRKIPVSPSSRLSSSQLTLRCNLFELLETLPLSSSASSRDGASKMSRMAWEMRGLSSLRRAYCYSGETDNGSRAPTDKLPAWPPSVLRDRH